MNSYEITENLVWVKNSLGQEVPLAQLEIEHILSMFKAKKLGRGIFP